jgi:large subunit ribosomal protein L23
MTEENTKKIEKKKALPKKNLEKSAILAYAVLVEPWITEKTHSAMAMNKYTFRIRKEADKKKVKKAIEDLYSVKVENISIINIGAKKKNFGRHVGMKSAIKKAIVTISKGQSIEIFKGA